MRSRWIMAAMLASALYVAVVGGTAYAATLNVATGSYYFGDGSIEAQVGDRLRFVIEDGGKGTPHTVEIDALGIHSGPLATSGTFTTGELTTPGTYYIFCNPHENKGHSGWLTVSGQATTTTVATTTTSTIPQGTTTTSAVTSTTSTLPQGQTTTTVANESTTTNGPDDSTPSDTVEAEDSDDTATPNTTEQGNQDPDDQAAEDEGTALQDDGIVTIGAVQPTEKPWLRSVWLAIILGIPLAALWLYAATRPTPPAKDPDTE